jgi:hypothetical protein
VFAKKKGTEEQMSEGENITQETSEITDENFIMLPVVDFVFKLLFGDIQHKERLISLLSFVNFGFSISDFEI